MQWPLNSHASGKVLTIIIDFCRTNATSCHHRSFRQPVGLLSILMIHSHSLWIYTSCHVHLCPHKLKTCIFFTNHSVTNLTGYYLCWYNAASCQFALSIVSLRYLMLAINWVMEKKLKARQINNFITIRKLCLRLTTQHDVIALTLKQSENNKLHTQPKVTQHGPQRHSHPLLPLSSLLTTESLPSAAVGHNNFIAHRASRSGYYQAVIQTVNT